MFQGITRYSLHWWEHCSKIYKGLQFEIDRHLRLLIWIRYSICNSDSSYGGPKMESPSKLFQT